MTFGKCQCPCTSVSRVTFKNLSLNHPPMILRSYDPTERWPSSHFTREEAGKLKAKQTVQEAEGQRGKLAPGHTAGQDGVQGPELQLRCSFPLIGSVICRMGGSDWEEFSKEGVRRTAA